MLSPPNETIPRSERKMNYWLTKYYNLRIFKRHSLLWTPLLYRQHVNCGTYYRKRNEHVLESTIMDKSLGTNLHLWRFFTRAKQIHLHLFSPSPSPPSYNVGHVYTLFLQSFNIVLGGGGGGEGKQHILKRNTVLF